MSEAAIGLCVLVFGGIFVWALVRGGARCDCDSHESGDSGWAPRETPK